MNNKLIEDRKGSKNNYTVNKKWQSEPNDNNIIILMLFIDSN